MDDRNPQSWSENGQEPEYWYCLKHHRVEPREGCRNADRLGPYATQQEAAAALQKVKERNEDWDNDPAWNDTDDEDNDSPEYPSGS